MDAVDAVRRAAPHDPLAGDDLVNGGGDVEAVGQPAEGGAGGQRAGVLHPVHVRVPFGPGGDVRVQVPDGLERGVHGGLDADDDWGFGVDGGGVRGHGRYSFDGVISGFGWTGGGRPAPGEWRGRFPAPAGPCGRAAG